MDTVFPVLVRTTNLPSPWLTTGSRLPAGTVIIPTDFPLWKRGTSTGFVRVTNCEEEARPDTDSAMHAVTSVNKRAFRKTGIDRPVTNK